MHFVIQLPVVVNTDRIKFPVTVQPKLGTGELPIDTVLISELEGTCQAGIPRQIIMACAACVIIEFGTILTNSVIVPPPADGGHVRELARFRLLAVHNQRGGEIAVRQGKLIDFRIDYLRQK